MIDQIRRCMQTALKLDEATAGRIAAETTAADVPGWTSVAHLSLILELEKTFRVQFANDEIAALASISAITASLRNKGVAG
ncbi:MAG: acyl carrier protein [Planctomycetes bacterium]|nr:acyl carrier protein [Planctomycetota bacterium]